MERGKTKVRETDARRELLADIQADVLDVEVVGQTIAGPLSPKAWLLHTTKGRHVTADNTKIVPNHACLKSLCEEITRLGWGKVLGWQAEEMIEWDG